MGDLHEIVDLNSVSRLFNILAFAGPIAGLVIGALLGLRKGNAKRGAAIGLLVGCIGLLNQLLWNTFRTITDRNGLDTVKNLFINLALFVAVGAVIGAAAGRMSRRQSVVQAPTGGDGHADAAFAFDGANRADAAKGAEAE